MYSVTYIRRGSRVEEYLDLDNVKDDRYRLAYLYSLEHFGHISDLCIDEMN